MLERTDERQQMSEGWEEEIKGYYQVVVRDRREGRPGVVFVEEGSLSLSRVYIPSSLSSGVWQRETVCYDL